MGGRRPTRRRRAQRVAGVAVSPLGGRPHFRLGVSGSRACGAGAGRALGSAGAGGTAVQVSDPAGTPTPRRPGAAPGIWRAGPGRAAGGGEAGPGRGGRNSAPPARRPGPDPGRDPPGLPPPQPPAASGPRGNLGGKLAPAAGAAGSGGGRQRGRRAWVPGGSPDPASPGNCGPGTGLPAAAPGSGAGELGPGARQPLSARRDESGWARRAGALGSPPPCV